MQECYYLQYKCHSINFIYTYSQWRIQTLKVRGAYSLARSNILKARQNRASTNRLWLRKTSVNIQRLKETITSILESYLSILSFCTCVILSHLLLLPDSTSFHFSENCSQHQSRQHAGAYTTSNKCPAWKIDLWLHSVTSTSKLFICV